MTESPVNGIQIDHSGDQVFIRIGEERWEGDARQAEKLLTRLHYVLGRARPGTHIASMFLNGGLWGAKFDEPDGEAAIRKMRELIRQLEARVGQLEAQADSEPR